jgi:hypothetical protein
LPSDVQIAILPSSGSCSDIHSTGDRDGRWEGETGSLAQTFFEIRQAPWSSTERGDGIQMADDKPSGPPPWRSPRRSAEDDLVVRPFHPDSRGALAAVAPPAHMASEN